jgi:hypothetical protein
MRSSKRSRPGQQNGCAALPVRPGTGLGRRQQGGYARLPEQIAAADQNRAPGFPEAGGQAFEQALFLARKGFETAVGQGRQGQGQPLHGQRQMGRAAAQVREAAAPAAQSGGQHPGGAVPLGMGIRDAGRAAQFPGPAPEQGLGLQGRPG